MVRQISLPLALSACTLAACAAHPDGKSNPGSDPLAGENGDGEGAKADSSHDTFGFLELHKSPDACKDLVSCTQYTLNRANRSSTQCFGSSRGTQCEVHAINWDMLQLSDSQIQNLEDALQHELDAGTRTQVLVRGSFQSAVDFVYFQPTDVWHAQLANGTSANGTFVQLFSLSDAACKPEQPCPAYLEAKLNSIRSDQIEDLDFGDNASDDSLVAAVEDQAGSTHGVIIVGTVESRSAVSYVDTLRTVDQVYLPITAQR
jgi:hypothetical protein